MEHFSSLPLRLVLIIDWPSQYKFDGGSGFLWMLSRDNSVIGCGGSLGSAGRLSNEPFEVPGMD